MNNSNQIIIVLDRSGSMSDARNETIEGFNNFLSEHKQPGQETILSLVQFDHEIEVIINNLPIAQVPALTKKVYIPRGTTSLLDAIGLTIDKTFKSHQLNGVPKKLIFTIITDGYENSSSLYNRNQIFEKIRLMESLHNWQFVFLGTNQDAIYEAASYGIKQQRAMYFSKDSKGINDLYIDLSHNIKLCLNEEKQFEFTKNQRDKQNRD